jgi:hypothetical protein
MKTSKTLTIDTCVKDLSDLFNEIGERYSLPLPRATGKNMQKFSFFYRYFCRYGRALYFVRPLYIQHLSVQTLTLF